MQRKFDGQIEMEKGLILRSTGSWYEVERPDGAIVSCRMVGKLRQEDIRLTNPVGVGDYVHWEMENEEESTGIIREILPRTNYVIRQSPRKKHQLHLLASNIDQAVLVVTVAHPKLKQGFIDRFLVMTEPYSIPVTIVFNKKDVYKEKDARQFEEMRELYTQIGYEVMLVSAFDETDIEKLREHLKDKTTLISGQSGVGKSTLVNAIEKGLELKTTDVSGFTGKGQHTTTFAEMFKLSFGGRIIDTPGIKTLSFNHLEAMDVAHNFREMFELSEHCRFHNCTHINEPGCAVKEALETGKVHELRYQNYLQILSEIEDQNYWERHNKY